MDKRRHISLDGSRTLCRRSADQLRIIAPPLLEASLHTEAPWCTVCLRRYAYRHVNVTASVKAALRELQPTETRS